MAVTVTVGQPVVMVRQYARQQRGTVVKVSRIWIEIQPDGTTHEWVRRRFRLDDQTDGSRIGAFDHFYTLDQWAEREREAEAATFLREQGIEVGFGSPWRSRTAALADLSRAAPAGPDGA